MQSQTCFVFTLTCIKCKSKTKQHTLWSIQWNSDNIADKSIDNSDNNVVTTSKAIKNRPQRLDDPKFQNLHKRSVTMELHFNNKQENILTRLHVVGQEASWLYAWITGQFVGWTSCSRKVVPLCVRLACVSIQSLWTVIGRHFTPTNKETVN